MTANARSAAKPAAITDSSYYTAENYAAEDSVGYLIATLRTKLFTAVDAEMEKAGFTAAQWPVLRAVADGGTPTAAELCRQMNYDTGSMTRMLNRLEEKGVIVREPSELDRRTVHLKITPAGRRIYPKLRDGAIRVLNRLVAGFSASEIRQLHSQLQRMHLNMGAVDDD